MDIGFNCPLCGQHLSVEERGAGMTVNCPSCKGQIEIPFTTAPQAPTISVPMPQNRMEKHKRSKYAIYVSKNSEQIGPFTKKELREAVRSGTISRDDWAWHKELSEW